MEYPKFKVCVRCFTFNQSKYITDALNGFVMQHTDFPFVCCIVDDASTDGEQEVIRKYVKDNFDLSEGSCHFERETDYAFITYAQHRTNRNCYFAVLYLKENHYSIKKPKMPYLSEWREMCEYEALCEGDDWWIKNDKLQKQISFLDLNPDYMMCGTNGLTLWDDGVSYPSYFNRVFKSRELLAVDIIGRWPMPTATLCLRQSVRENYPEWSKKIYSGDMTLTLVALAKGRIYCLSDITSVYRKNGNPWSATNMSRAKGKAYVPEQHKVLYSYYMEYTGEKFKEEITAQIESLDKLISFYHLQEKSVFLSWLRYPKMSFVMWLKSKKQPLLQKLYGGTILK